MLVVVGLLVVMVVLLVVVWGVVVVGLVVPVVVVVVVVGVVVLVVGLVVVVVLRVCPQDPLALRRDYGVGHHLQPLALQGLVGSRGRFWGWVSQRPWWRGPTSPGFVWQAAVIVCGGRMARCVEMGMWTRLRTGRVAWLPRWQQFVLGVGGRRTRSA